MQTLRFLSKLTLGLALGFSLLSCGSDDDPAPTGGGGGGGGGGGTGGGTGTISTTCTSSLSGSGSFVLNGVSSQGGIIITGFCTGSVSPTYTATISDSTERDIVISFRGMPNSGTFNIKNLLDYSSSTTVADCYIAVDNGGSTTYSSRTISTKITVTRNSSSIRIQLPSVTLDRLSSSGANTIPAQADFTINL